MPVQRGHLDSKLADDVTHVYVETIRYGRTKCCECDVQNATGTSYDRGWRRLRFAAAVESELDVTPASFPQEIGNVDVLVEGMPPATLVDRPTGLAQSVEIQ